jgi:hypothetical protein
MAVTDFKAESFLFMVLEVLLSDENYFEMKVISATFGDKGIGIYPGKMSTTLIFASADLSRWSGQSSCSYLSKLEPETRIGQGFDA